MPPKPAVPDLSVTPRFTFDVTPLARFAGEFACIVHRTTFSKALELGLLEFADSADTEDKASGRRWEDYWNRSAGSVASAWALLLADRALPLNYEQQQIRELLLAHERFFFDREGKQLTPKRRNIEALWPHIQHGTLTTHWEKTKAVDSWATGGKMSEILKKAGLRPPAWGPGHE